MFKYKNAIKLLVLSLLITVGATAPAWAAGQTSTTSSVQTVAQSYKTATPLQQGLIVQVDDKDATAVIPATYKDAKKTFGVVVSPNDSAVSLSSDASNQAYVVTSGRYKVLVSNQRGPIGKGDPISVSAISGIGMKADTLVSTILGRAVTSFDGKTNVISTTGLKDSSGKEVKVALGTVTVDIDVRPNPTLSLSQNGVPNFIQRMAITIVGKPIAAPQLYASIAILIAGIAVVASLLYGGIQTSMISIGRNPLAKKSIMRNMMQVIITGILIFVGCLVAVYLIMKI